MKSSVDDDRQFKLNALGGSKPVKTGESICNMLRVTKTSDRPIELPR